MVKEKTKVSKRRRVLKIGCLIAAAVFTLILGLLLFVGQSGFSFTADKFTENDFSGIMKANLTFNPRAVDIAMLGAHDAFSHQISRGSKVDPQEDDGSILNNGIVKVLAGGMFVRLATAQKSGAAELFKRGVRYFDVRITRADDEWYTTHGLLSGKLEDYLKPLVEVLYLSPGEFIIFDIQHAYLGDKSFEDLFEYIASIKYNDMSLFDFVLYNPHSTPLETLRYNDITNDGLTGGAVVLAKTGQYAGCFHYKYADSIRSVWHEKNTQSEMLEGIDAEYNTLKDDVSLDRNKFRVNQAQMTGLFSGSAIINTIFSWSLLDMAADFNPKLAAHEDFQKWLSVMPIFMVDYSDSNKDDFSDKVVEKINLYNQSL